MHEEDETQFDNTALSVVRAWPAPSVRLQKAHTSCLGWWRYLAILACIIFDIRPHEACVQTIFQVMLYSVYHGAHAKVPL